MTQWVAVANLRLLKHVFYKMEASKALFVLYADLDHKIHYQQIECNRPKIPSSAGHLLKSLDCYTIPPIIDTSLCLLHK